jgi:hypothetical protein
LLVPVVEAAEAAPLYQEPRAVVVQVVTEQQQDLL